MTTKQILSDYYELVATKGYGDRTLNVYKAKGMGELPKSLLDDYAKPECLCGSRPFKGLRYSTGNPDWGEWDAQVVLVSHGSVVDLYVCAILARPFSEEARQKYESMMGQLPQKRVALLWDSRDYDEVHGFERVHGFVEDEKPKKVNKRPRATLRQLRALQEEKDKAIEERDACFQTCRDYDQKIQRLESEIGELRNKYSYQLTADRDLSEKVIGYKTEIDTLSRSNKLMEEELNRLRNACDTLNKLNDERLAEITRLNSRGFWARVFNN